MEKELFNPKIIQDKIKDCEDSFFYDGTIAQITKPNGTELFLIATGEIRIFHTDNGKAVGQHNGFKSYDDFPLDIKSDKDLEQIGNGYNDKYYWDMNNWFEVTFQRKGDDFIDCDIGIVDYSYDDAIELLKSYYEDEQY